MRTYWFFFLPRINISYARINSVESCLCAKILWLSTVLKFEAWQYKYTHAKNLYIRMQRRKKNSPMLTTGIEPATVGLLDQCSTDWATRAYHVIYIASHHRGQAGIEPAASRTLNENHTTRPLAHIHLKKIFWSAPTRARTGDLSVNSRSLCQLSHRSTWN